jgi:transposase
MKRFLEICAGIDIGKREIAVTILTGAANSEPTAETRTFGTTTRELTECAEWLHTGGCSTVVMESTGSYWLPVWNVLHTGFGVIIANPDHVKARRGEKTDAEDSRRLAERLRVGDVRGSFVPPDKVVVLRDLTRRRKRLLTAANSERNRVQKLLERANVKFGNVVSDVFGVSGQRFLAALLKPEPPTPADIAELARGRLRNKIAQITETIEGHRLDRHRRWMIQHCLDHLVFLEKQIAELRTETIAALAPFQREFELLQTIPGVGEETAAVIIAETGGNMAQFPTHRNLTSWAGVCPGNNMSAGRQKSGAIKHGNKWLMSALVQAGWAAVRQRGSIFKKRFYRQMQHRGRKRAVVATARQVLCTVWITLTRGEPYREPSGDFQAHERSKKVRHHLRKLAQLGVDISALQLPEPTPAELRRSLQFKPPCIGALGIHAR